MSERGKFNISDQDKLIVGSILGKVQKITKPLAVINFDELNGVLNGSERHFVDRVVNIDGAHFDAKLPHLGVTATPADLVAIQNQSYLVESDGSHEEKAIPTQYLPKRTFQAYLEMNRAMTADLGRGVLVESGYRSPACQAITLTDLFQRERFGVSKVLTMAALVYHSEHGHPPTQAMDLATITGIGEGGVDARFAGTEEHEWLMQKAGKFGFIKSYPADNRLGITHESWHWSHRE